MSRQKKMLCTVWLVAGLVVCVTGQVEDIDADLPLMAQSAIREMNLSIELAKKKAVEKLQTALKAEMQAGRLDRANKVNQLIKQLSSPRPASVASLGKENSSVVGEWKRRDGVAYIFRNDFTIELANGWQGSWKIISSKISIELDQVGGKKAETVLRYQYDLPVEKVETGRAVLVLQAQAGNEGMALFRDK